MIKDFNQEFLNIINLAENNVSPRELKILYLRNGYSGNKKVTLEDIAAMLGGVTRERVRQIESSAIVKLNKPFVRNDIILKFVLCFEEMYHLFRKNNYEGYDDFYEPSYIRFNEYITIISEDVFYKAVAIYLAITDNKARIKVSQKFKFIYNSNGANETDAALMILGLYKNVISQEEASALDDESKKILLSNYRLNDGVYLRRGMILRDIILSIIDDNFPNGYRIYSTEYLDKFKTIYKGIYHIDCTIGVREIASAIGNSGNYCLVNLGTYLRYDKCSIIPQELLDNIMTYILDDGGTIYYSTIFSEFKNDLVAIGIDNWFYLKGMLDKQAKGMFFNRKATLSVNSTEQFEDPIYDYISNSDGVVTLQELRNKFPGLKDYMFQFRIYSNPEIISIGNGKTYVHVDNLKLDGADLIIIKQFIRKKIRENEFEVVSSRTLYPLFKIEYPEIAKRLGIINEQYGFFSLCYYLLKDELQFARPFIGRCAPEEMTLNNILSRYATDYLPNRFSFSDLDAYAAKYNTYLSWKIAFVEDNADKFLLINDNKFIKTKELPINNAEQIKNFLVFTTKQLKEIVVSNFRGYFLIPKNEYIYWNKATLFSFIKAYCSDALEIQMINGSFDNLDYVIRSING